MKAAIVGTGLMGRWHAAAVKKTGNSIVAVTDQNPDSAKKFASRFGTRAFENISLLLEWAKPEAVHICTPVETHFDLAQMALKAGCHVLVEKPIAGDATLCEQLYRLAESRGVVLCPVHQFLFQPGIQNIKKNFFRLGKCVQFECTIFTAGGTSDKIIAEILPHPLSLLQFFFPGVLPIMDWRILLDPGEWMAIASTGALQICLRISLQARPPQCSLRLFGTLGTFYADLFHGYSIWRNGKVSRLHKVAQPFLDSLSLFTAAGSNLLRRTAAWEPAYPGLGNLISLFYDAIQGKGPVPISSEDVLTVERERERIIAAPAISSR